MCIVLVQSYVLLMAFWDFTGFLKKKKRKGNIDLKEAVLLVVVLYLFFYLVLRYDFWACF